MSLLNRIKNPSILKNLSSTQLISLCQEIRVFMEKIVFKTGGHLSSNLGVVELTVALHYIFDFLEEDKLIFDVSHQSYVHKILTGRKDVFHTLRQQYGICGYTNPKESSYDNFIFAHAGTAISASLGIAIAKRLNQSFGKTIALVGDASMSTGVAFEGLNYAGHIRENLLVILNDNFMSISESIGSLSEYLTKIRVAPIYTKFKNDFKLVLENLPGIGDRVKKTVEHLGEKIKRYLTGGDLFEELNFNYYGPIDGHNLPLLIDVLQSTKEKNDPILLHVITEKGKGNHEAIHNPEKYHGISPQKKLNLSKKQYHISFTEAFSQSLINLAYKDPKIIAITAAMPSGTGLNKFQKIFPERYFDVGICEQHAIAMAAGQSIMNMKPVCAIYSTFLQRAYDQIFQEICLNNNHVILAMDRSGIVGPDGATHAGLFDIAYLRTFPNMILMAPRNSYELQQMLYFASNLDSPVAIRYPRDNCYYPFDSSHFTPIQMGKGQILKHGNDLIFLAYGSMVQYCLESSYILEKQGFSSTVVNARFAKPIDQNLMSYLLDQKKPIVTVEDHSIQGGFGSAVLESVNQSGKNSSKIYILGVIDQFTEHGTRAEVLKNLSLDPQGITSFVIHEILSKKSMSILI